MNFYYYIIVAMSASFLLCLFMVFFYFKYRKNIAEQQYKLKVTELYYQKELLHTTIASQESERKRIGMNLHDEIGASLAGIKFGLDHFLDTLKMDANDTQTATAISNMINQVIVSTRNISHELSPYIKGTYGFYDAFSNFCDLINQSGKIQVDIEFSDNKIKTILKEMQALLVYRILVELINNSLKHANAKRIGIVFSLSHPNLTIEYFDDGIGFSQNDLGGNKGIGFHNIESRLSYLEGNYTISNSYSKTHIKMIIPLK